MGLARQASRPVPCPTPHTHTQHTPMQAMRELSALTQVPELDLCATAAMLHAHEAAKVVDHDAVMELQNKLEVRCREACSACRSSSQVPTSCARPHTRTHARTYAYWLTLMLTLAPKTTL